MNNQLFSESERELIDMARIILSDGLNRLKSRKGLFPLRGASRAERAEVVEARNTLCEHLIATYGPLRYEIAVAVMIDAQGRLIDIQEFPRGGTKHCPVSFRILAGWICASGADSVILAHNHPSGESSPSKQDIALTTQCKTWLAGMDCHLVEHFVVTCDETSAIIGGF